MRSLTFLILVVIVGCASAACREPIGYSTPSDSDKGIPSGVD
jgi:hypothetical protein